MSSIRVEVTVERPIEQVWTCWTSPEHITQWNQASADWHTPSAENDLRVGGKFKSTMAAKDGSVSFDFTGTYTTVTFHKVIAYTMDDGRKTTITFEPLNNGVKIVEIFEAEGTHTEEMQRAGWQAILDSFKAYTTSRSA